MFSFQNAFEGRQYAHVCSFFQKSQLSYMVAYIMLCLNDTVESTVSLWLLVKSFWIHIFPTETIIFLTQNDHLA